jgi:hypothetical protein
MHESPAGVAQLAEQPSCKRQVIGSNPFTGSQLRGAAARGVERPEIMLPSPGVVPTVNVMECRFSAMRNQDWHVAILPSAMRGTSAEASG